MDARRPMRLNENGALPRCTPVCGCRLGSGPAARRHAQENMRRGEVMVLRSASARCLRTVGSHVRRWGPNSRRERARDSALVRWHISLPVDDVARLPRPVGEPAGKGSRLVAARESAEGRTRACRGGTPLGSHRIRTGGPPHLGHGGRAGRSG